MRSLVILGGNSHPSLVGNICGKLNIEQSKVSSSRFANGETQVTIKESVREKDVYVIQSGCGPVNDNFIELLIMVSACKMASAGKITVVMPLFPYSRQPEVPFLAGSKKLLNNNNNNSNNITPSSNRLDRGYKQWTAQTGTLIASLLTCAGADHIITMDLHDPQFQGFFDIPVDNLYGKPLLQHYIVNNIRNYQEAIIVSPDAGGAKRATAIADSLAMGFALIHKEGLRESRRAEDQTSQSGQSEAQVILSSNINENAVEKHQTLVGDVENRVAIIIDDIIDTASTIIKAAAVLKQHGACKVYAVATHGILSGNAAEAVKNSDIDQLVVTNTTPQDAHKEVLGDQMHVLDVSRVFGEAIRRIHNGESVSMLFDHYT